MFNNKDVAINNSLFSNFVFIDESRQVEKVKRNIYVHFVFNSFYQDTVNGNGISASLNQLVVQPNDYKLITTGFEIGEKYTEVKIIRATDEQIVRQFILAFSRLLKVYEKETDSIIKKYTKKIPNFDEYIKKEKERKIVEKADQKLTSIVPKIFLAKNYPRQCAESIQPIIINDIEYKRLLTEYDLPKNYVESEELEEEKEEIKRSKLHSTNLLQNALQLIEKNDLLTEEYTLLIDLYGDNWKENIRTLLRIPIFENDREIFIYPRKNELPRRYMVISKIKPYIGLKENIGPNRDLFPFLPCSYKNPQYRTTDKTLKGAKKMKSYYGIDIDLKSTIASSYTIKTNKYVLSDQIGEFIPKNIYEFLHTVDNDKDKIFYRKGISSNLNDFANSSLEAITIATYDFLDKDNKREFKSNKKQYFKNKREEMLKYVNEIYQTSYQYTNIVKIIKETIYKS